MDNYLSFLENSDEDNQETSKNKSSQYKLKDDVDKRFSFQHSNSDNLLSAPMSPALFRVMTSSVH